MYIQKVAPSIAEIRTLAKNIMNENNMHFENASESTGHYFQAGDYKRVILSVANDEFIQKEQRFNNGEWMDAVEIRVKGSIETIENMFINTILDLFKVNKDLVHFKNIK